MKCHHLLPIPFFSSWSNAIVLYALIGSFLLAGKICYYWLICTRKKYLMNHRIRLQMLKDYELDYKSDESQNDSEVMLKGI